MKNGILLFCVVAFSVFVVTTVGGLVTSWNAQALSPMTPTVDPQVIATLQARDQEARDLIALANERILTVTETPLPTSEPTVTTLPSPTPWPISPAAARAIAHVAASWATLTAEPVLVDYQGVTAYEVQTNLGPIYIDATTGQVLFNGALRIADYVPPAPSGGGGGSGGGGNSEDHGSEHDD
jgi:hypothetical protein